MKYLSWDERRSGVLNIEGSRADRAGMEKI